MLLLDEEVHFLYESNSCFNLSISLSNSKILIACSPLKLNISNSCCF